jgi:hypothetical protein
VPGRNRAPMWPFSDGNDMPGREAPGLLGVLLDQGGHHVTQTRSKSRAPESVAYRFARAASSSTRTTAVRMESKRRRFGLFVVCVIAGTVQFRFVTGRSSARCGSRGSRCGAQPARAGLLPTATLYAWSSSRQTVLTLVG